MQFFSEQTSHHTFPISDFQKTLFCCFLTCLFLFLPLNSNAKIHKWIDENGKIHYGDKPPKQIAPLKDPLSKSNSEPSAHTQLKPVSGGALNSIVLRIRNHFLAGEFNRAEKVLVELQTRSEANIANEPELFSSLKAFELNDEQYLDQFNQWIAQSPKSFFAHLAKARFLFQLGWSSRGGKWRQKTSQSQFNAMENYFAKAKASLKTSVSLAPASTLPYSMYISIATAIGDANATNRYLSSGLKLEPSSYELRKVYIHSIKPRWGGSLEQMRVFADNAQYYSEQNPILKRLLGEALAESGVIAHSKQQYQKADKLFNKALLHGDDPEVYFKRAKTRYRLNLFSRAITDLNTAIKLSPDIAEYYKWRYYNYVQIKKFDKALHDIKRASLLTPNDQAINDILAKTLSLANAPGTRQKSISVLNSKLFEFDAQIEAQPNNAYHYFRKGHYLLSSNLFAQSEKPLRQAIKIDPRQFDYYRALDLALFKQGKLDEIIIFWEQYLTIKPNDGRAYLERAGTFYHMQNYKLAKIDAKKAVDLGIKEAKPFYNKLKSL